MRNKKKAFTLTELLVVVIVIGVLSAAVLPKFSKVIETRKTTEAEGLMSAIRTEQEKRCALDKPYVTDFSKLADLIKTGETKNYSLSLQDKGVLASSKGKYSYNLEIPSYADGRICCSGSDCEKLNKSYPSCEELIARANYQESPDSCVGEVPPTSPVSKPCSGKKEVTQPCTGGSTCGFETRTATCDTSTGNWIYGAWNKSACVSRPDTSRDCPSGTGTQTRSVVCKNGSWDIGDWTGTCTTTNGCSGEKPADFVTDCGPCQEQTVSYECKEVASGTYRWVGVAQGCHAKSGPCEEEPPVECPNGTRPDSSCKEKIITYAWKHNADSADIPAARCNTNVNSSVCSENINFGESNCRSGQGSNGSTITTIPGYQYGPNDQTCTSAGDVGKFYTIVSVSKKAYSAGTYPSTNQLWWYCSFTQFACNRQEVWQ